MPRTPFDDLDDGHVLTPQDIAERLRVDPRSVRRAIARGDLAASNTCGLRVLACDAAAWWRAKSVKATPGATADSPPVAVAPVKPARRSTKRFARSTGDRLPLPPRAVQS
ncbi:MAG TPA: helix-turn-helix domain-containing protein [Solirubrobacteraceae bacterium]|nr:helix-turn-helix domain-containing protein [Solirubrobacteraceae bacterium]